jgi:putative NADH-flavin reductase
MMKEPHMKIAIFGAAGRIGQRIASEAVRRGHRVTGISRSMPDGGTKGGERDRLKGDATDPSSVAESVKGFDAVVSAIGPNMQSANWAMLAKAARALVEGLRKAGVKRLVVVGGAGSLEVSKGTLLMDSPLFPADWKPLAAAHHDALKSLRTVKDLDWTYLSPAGLIEPGERTGKYRTGSDQLVSDAAGKSFISMEDYAVALLDELEHPQHIKKRFTVGY